VECALECKDVDILIRLLDNFAGPAQLSSKCSLLVQLCTMQQLAADFAESSPAEVRNLCHWHIASLITLCYSIIGCVSATTMVEELGDGVHVW
jgi:hypothetical protein